MLLGGLSLSTVIQLNFSTMVLSIVGSKTIGNVARNPLLNTYTYIYNVCVHILFLLLSSLSSPLPCFSFLLIIYPPHIFQFSFFPLSHFLPFSVYIYPNFQLVFSMALLFFSPSNPIHPSEKRMVQHVLFSWGI